MTSFAVCLKLLLEGGVPVLRTLELEATLAVFVRLAGACGWFRAQSINGFVASAVRNDVSSSLCPHGFTGFFGRRYTCARRLASKRRRDTDRS
ncbi:MAG: hypothetical protein ACYCOU_04900 [Sulfobacillus sp.]